LINACVARGGWVPRNLVIIINNNNYNNNNKNNNNNNNNNNNKVIKTKGRGGREKTLKQSKN